MFSPTIGDRSRQLAKRIKDPKLVKHTNGKTENLDFYKVQPPNISQSDLYYTKGRKAPVESKRENRHFEGCEGRSRSGRSIPGKKKKVHPNYVSPYTKEVMQSDIPLKTVLNKAEKLRNSPRKKRRK